MLATIYFLKLFAYALWAIMPLLTFLSVIILGLAFWVGRIEHWAVFDRIYWGFITATTVGYGDKVPHHPISKLFSIIIALSGIIMTGIIVSCAVYAASQVLKVEIDPQELERLQDQHQQHVNKHNQHSFQRITDKTL
ncbi:MAG: two pore domain potassium channel family protein [Pseudomonadales bacterium]|nr:two pore domain potassium channel family protein [Pseudomonadales bacterium]